MFWYTDPSINGVAPDLLIRLYQTVSAQTGWPFLWCSWPPWHILEWSTQIPAAQCYPLITTLLTHLPCQRSKRAKQKLGHSCIKNRTTTTASLRQRFVLFWCCYSVQPCQKDHGQRKSKHSNREQQCAAGNNACTSPLFISDSYPINTSLHRWKTTH